MITLDKFITNTKGTKQATPWGTNEGQCVSLVQQYIIQCLNQNAKPMGDAKDWVNTYVANGYGTIVSNSSAKKGDIIVFTNEGTYGHIGIYISSTQIYDQNNLRHDNGCAGYGTMFSQDYKILRPIVNAYIGYQAHVQDIGWQGEVYDGATAGTTGKSLRMEAIKLETLKGGTVEFVKAHIQNIGWKTYKAPSSSTIIGTTGKSLRLEALKIKLDGYKFRGHIQDIGWTGWKKCDGTSIVGTTGQSLRLEAIQIKKV